MKPSLTGKIALVTGASRGIGRAIAQRLASAGATVVVTARSLDRAVELTGTLHETVTLIEKNGGKAIPLACDLENSEQLHNLVQRTVDVAGGLDILINNAGLAHFSTIDKMPESMFDATVDHYLKIPFILCKAAIPFMRARGAGWIVNLGSVTAMAPMKPYIDWERTGGVQVYAAIKLAMHRFSQGLAAELENDYIAVNVVGPSTAISTPGADRVTPEGYPTENIAYIAETVLAMCHLPAKERTGLIGYSLHFPLAHNLPVYSLDGREQLPPPVIPPYAHPAIVAKGE